MLAFVSVKKNTYLFKARQLIQNRYLQGPILWPVIKKYIYIISSWLITLLYNIVTSVTFIITKFFLSIKLGSLGSRNFISQFDTKLDKKSVSFKLFKYKILY